MHACYCTFLRANAMRAGYIGSASLLQEIANLLKELRQHNPDLIYSAQLPFRSDFCMSAQCTHHAG